MLKLFKFFKSYLWQFAVLLVLVFVTVWTSLQLPDYMAKIINDGIVAKDNAVIWHNGLTMLIISLIGAVATVGVGYFASIIATSVSRDMREKLFARVESFSLIEFNKFSTASLITRSTNDVQQIQMVLVMLLRMVLQAPLTGLWAIYKAYNVAPSMTWVMGLAVAVLVTIIIILFTVALPKFQLLQKMVDKLNLVTRENLTGLRVIRAFNNEKLEENKFEKANVDLTNTNLFVNRVMVIMQPIMMIIFNLTAISVVWVGSHLIGEGSLLIGNMIAFMQYSMQVIMAFLMISIIFIMVPRASISAKRVMEVIETEPVILDPKKPKKALKKVGSVEFKDVSFAYPKSKEPVLCNISFSALPGKTTAIVGGTGSGKSTLVNLIPRFYDSTEGEILVDGLNVKNYRLEDLYQKIGYVPQKAVLFSGTIESNIKYGAPNAAKSQVEESAKTAQATEFIKHLPDKFKNNVAQDGTNVSGGQKQRLSIARAIARDPEIYIFDDSFSALDFKTDANLRKALKKQTAEKTVIIVAQRIATVLDADQIIVLDDGKIDKIGSHNELMETSKVYREIASSQLSEEELAKYRHKTRLKVAEGRAS